VLVLRVFPLGPDALFEEMIVCLEAKFGRRRDVVLGEEWVSGGRELTIWISYVDAPEFLNRVKSDDLLEKVVPVVALGIVGQHLARPIGMYPSLPCH
jgi:hypothetical protein